MRGPEGLGIHIYLSRRNLLALLAKLDGYPEGSSCSIIKDGLQVTAEEDEKHYRERVPGEMHRETERRMKVLKGVKRGREE